MLLILHKRSAYFVSSLGCSGSGHVGQKSRKRLVRDVFDSLSHNDTDCWAQNGGTHALVFTTFKRRFLTKTTSGIPLSVFFILFHSSIRLVVPLRSGSPLTYNQPFGILVSKGSKGLCELVLYSLFATCRFTAAHSSQQTMMSPFVEYMYACF